VARDLLDAELQFVNPSERSVGGSLKSRRRLWQARAY
jgi:hypothetical protein